MEIENNKLIIGLFDYNGKDYLNSVIKNSNYDNIFNDSKICSFSYLVVPFDKDNNIIESFEFKNIQNDKNEKIFDLTECDDIIVKLGIYINNSFVNQDTNYCIYICNKIDDKIIFSFDLLDSKKNKTLQLDKVHEIVNILKGEDNIWRLQIINDDEQIINNNEQIINNEIINNDDDSAYETDSSVIESDSGIESETDDILIDAVEY